MTHRQQHNGDAPRGGAGSAAAVRVSPSRVTRGNEREEPSKEDPLGRIASHSIVSRAVSWRITRTISCFSGRPVVGCYSTRPSDTQCLVCDALCRHCRTDTGTHSLTHRRSRSVPPSANRSTKAFEISVYPKQAAEIAPVRTVTVDSCLLLLPRFISSKIYDSGQPAWLPATFSHARVDYLVRRNIRSEYILYRMSCGAQRAL